MGNSSFKCCTNNSEQLSHIQTTSSDILFSLNLSLQDILILKENPKYLLPNSKKSNLYAYISKQSKENDGIQSISETTSNSLDNNIEYLTETEKSFQMRGIKLRVLASYDEQMFPIWVDKGAILKFKVSGKWSLYYNTENKIYVSSKGDISNPERIFDFPIGCLLGRIQGEDFVFAVNNNTEIKVKNRGCLFLFQNNGQYETFPKGFLDVEIIGGRQYSYLEIEKLLNWPVHLLNKGLINTNNFINIKDNIAADELIRDTLGYTNRINEISKELIPQEKEIIYFINKLRYNPRLFCEYFISHLKSLSSYYYDAYAIISKYSKYRKSSLFGINNEEDYSNVENNRDNRKVISNNNYHRLTSETPASNKYYDLKESKTNSDNIDQYEYKNNEVKESILELEDKTTNSFSNNAFKLRNKNEFILEHSEKLQRISGRRAIMKNYYLNNNDDLIKENNIDEYSIENMLLEEGIESDCFCELCTFGKSSAFGVLSNLLIDDDEIDNKMNRESLINGNFTHVGVSIKEHSEHGFVCCIILAKLEKS